MKRTSSSSSSLVKGASSTADSFFFARRLTSLRIFFFGMYLVRTTSKEQRISLLYQKRGRMDETHAFGGERRR